MSREKSVAEFNRAGNNKTFSEGGNVKPQINCFMEEADELFIAVSDFINDPNTENRKQLCKEWADAQVTLSNLAWFFEIPADTAFNRVHQSNMTKVVDGKLVYREDGKIMKPEGYKKPDMRGL